MTDVGFTAEPEKPLIERGTTACRACSTPRAARGTPIAFGVLVKLAGFFRLQASPLIAGKILAVFLHESCRYPQPRADAARRRGWRDRRRLLTPRWGAGGDIRSVRVLPAPRKFTYGTVTAWAMVRVSGGVVLSCPLPASSLRDTAQRACSTSGFVR